MRLFLRQTTPISRLPAAPRPLPPLLNIARAFATMATEQAAEGPKKLHGRAFYESIGSPKFIVAPMVDQSEFVRHG